MIVKNCNNNGKHSKSSKSHLSRMVFARENACVCMFACGMCACMRMYACMCGCVCVYERVSDRGERMGYTHCWRGQEINRTGRLTGL